MNRLLCLMNIFKNARTNEEYVNMELDACEELLNQVFLHLKECAAKKVIYFPFFFI